MRTLAKILLGLVVVALGVAAWFAVPFAARTTEVVPRADGRFHFSYYLYVPASAGPRLVILVMPNNTGKPDDDPGVHARKSLARTFAARRMADDLGVALLVPTFPRPASDWRVYTHALDRDTLETDLPGLARLDHQLEAMIDDARLRLAGRGFAVEPRVLMAGFSANGMFTDRFTALHPERVLAAAIGSPGGWPIAPVAEHRGRRLRYPIGVADVPFDAAAHAAVPRFYYMGEKDGNDSVDYGDGWDEPDARLVDELFGDDPIERWPAVRAFHPGAEVRLYPGVGHHRTAEMDRDVRAFFARAMEGRVSRR